MDAESNSFLAMEAEADGADRLTIAKLFLITTVVAIVMALPVARQRGEINTPIGLIGAVLASVQVVGLPLIMLRLWHVSWKQIAPGEWLWATLGLATLVGFGLAWLFQNTLLPASGPLGIVSIYVAFAAILVVPAVFCRGIFWRLTTLPQALLYFGLAIAFQMRGLDLMLATQISQIEIACGGAVLVIATLAIWRDWLLGIRRYWSHWAGLLVFAAVQIMTAAVQYLAAWS